MAKLAASKSFPVKPNRSYTVTKYICRFSPSTAYRLGRLFSLLAVPYPRLLYNMLEPIMLAAGWIETSIRRPPTECGTSNTPSHCRTANTRTAGYRWLGAHN
ncbi:hypothetical protein PMIN07_002352 [Paraphaeosphaeria minitans]